MPVITVTFAVTIGGGSISASSVTTDSNGQAETTLTLGTTAGSNRVVASVSGITQTRNFNATGQAAVATTIVEISGDGQAGDAGATLNDPFIVEVRDQDGDALSGVAVAFAVTGGGGSLSASSVTTDASGRAESTLTLGATTTNTVTATASGITTPITFTATVVASLSFGTGTISNQAWEVGTAVSLTLPGAAGVTGTITYALSPTPPPGVNFTASTRKLTGNPTLEFSSATFTYTATAGTKSVTLTFRIVVTDPSIVSTPRATSFQSHSVSLTLEIAGVDMTEYLPARAPLQLARSRDFPSFSTFNSVGVNIPLRNESNYFDPGNASNFFVGRSLPANGRGARVFLTVVRDGTEKLRFAGEVVMINQNLETSLVTLVVRDLSIRLRRGKITNFGETVSFRITDYPDVAAEYQVGDYAFRFPNAFRPIQRDSVSATIEVDGTDETIEILANPVIAGDMTYRKAVVDYENALLILQGEPPDGEDSVIDASWKISYRFKRPDFLIREIMKEKLFPSLPNYGVERVGFEVSDSVFGTHGKPYFQETGIVRWLKRQGGTNPAMWMAHDNRLVKYDEALDEYEEVAEVPDDTSITEVPPGGYGSYVPDELISLEDTPSSIRGIAVRNNRIVVMPTTTRGYSIRPYDENGNNGATFFSAGASTGNLNAHGLDIYDNNAYVAWVGHPGNQVYSLHYRRHSLIGGSHGSTISVSASVSSSSRPKGIAVTPTRILIGLGNNILFYDHDGNAITDENFSPGYTFTDIAVNANYIFVLASDQIVHVHTYNGAELTQFEIDPSPYSLANISVNDLRLFGNVGGDIHAYSLAESASYQGFVIAQFDTHDFDSFYCLTTNTLRGDITRDTTFNRNRVDKYVKSTDTWSTLLAPDDGEPQLAHPVDLMAEIGKYADNRKNFQVIRRSNKTLIFYRRVQTSDAGIAYYNETDDTLTDIYSETFGTNDGLPYSMDFALDERTDGIYVYTFVVKYALSGSTFTSATLKVYRERVEPSAAQTEIFSETFTGTSDTDEYPVSVSDVILADDRSKLCFVLEYVSESTTEAGKSELCEIAKDGTGSRTVLKTYDNPLVGPRSPVKRGSDYFYLEGGWARLPKTSTDDDVPVEEHYYPNEGGRLIEIESNGDITDHGVVWRSAARADSPNPESEVYDGWGLYNSVVSNMIADDQDNLHFIAGYGLPFLIANNLPASTALGESSRIDNFAWLQFGTNLPMKLENVVLEGKDYWSACVDMAVLNDSELGFTPQASLASAYETANPTADLWEAWSTLFFRERTIVAGELRAALAIGSTATTTDVDGVGLTEFPATGGLIIINRELFTYTGAAVNGNGVRLSGLSRAQEDSVAAAHAEADAVLFVDLLIKDSDTSLIEVETKNLDIANSYNAIIINHADGEYRLSDAVSVAESGEIALSIAAPFFSDATAHWNEELASRYLARFKELRDVVTCRIPFAPAVEIGQLVVLKTERGFISDFAVYEVMRQAHDLRAFRTTLILRGR